MPNQRLLTHLTPLLRRTLPLHHRSLLRLQPLPFPSPSPTADHFPNPRVCDPVIGIGFSGSGWGFGARFWSGLGEGGEGKGKCWNCGLGFGDGIVGLVCEGCGVVQPADEAVDYFRIFGLEKKFDIELGGLEGKYKGWQKKLHPDLVHSKSERERAYAAEQSARVIDAYRTLSDPLSRAIYLMKLEGVHVDEEQTVSDIELLVEMMEIREAVEEAADSQGLRSIQSQIHEKQKQWAESFSKAFQDRNTEVALNSIRRLTYYQRADEEIVKKL
ncbi:hypothetical protein Droror1_Dr00008640 [Drosera rotundifolia]